MYSLYTPLDNLIWVRDKHCWRPINEKLFCLIIKMHFSGRKITKFGLDFMNRIA